MALIVISGPSGVGKSSLCKALMKSELDGLLQSVSYTTRPQRPGEKPGLDYHFVSRAKFLSMSEDLLEQTFYAGHLYGTSKTLVEKAIAVKQSVLFDLDHQGALSIKRYAPATLILCTPPSLNALEKRLRDRGDKEEEIQKRMLMAQDHLMQKDCYDHVIVNDDLELAFQKLLSIVTPLVSKK